MTVETRALLAPKSGASVQYSQFGKAVMDVVMAAFLIVLLVPVFVTIALAIKLSSRGPVLFVQDRVGRGGHLFPFFKFRTMEDGAHLRRAEILGTPDTEMNARYQSDPRITVVGKHLRRWSVDELPQLFNVLLGHMSIVGPRPILEDEEILLEAKHHERHDAKPGLTGLWQVSGRKETTWEERMDLDVEYVRECSVPGDLSIMARTVKVIAKGDGAY